MVAAESGHSGPPGVQEALRVFSGPQELALLYNEGLQLGAGADARQAEYALQVAGKVRELFFFSRKMPAEIKCVLPLASLRVTPDTQPLISNLLELLRPDLFVFDGDDAEPLNDVLLDAYVTALRIVNPAVFASGAPGESNNGNFEMMEHVKRDVLQITSMLAHHTSRKGRRAQGGEGDGELLAAITRSLTQLLEILTSRCSVGDKNSAHAAHFFDDKETRRIAGVLKNLSSGHYSVGTSADATRALEHMTPTSIKAVPYDLLRAHVNTRAIMSVAFSSASSMRLAAQSYAELLAVFQKTATIKQVRLDALLECLVSYVHLMDTSVDRNTMLADLTAAINLRPTEQAWRLSLAVLRGAHTALLGSDSDPDDACVTIIKGLLSLFFDASCILSLRKDPNAILFKGSPHYEQLVTLLISILVECIQGGNDNVAGMAAGLLITAMTDLSGKGTTAPNAASGRRSKSLVDTLFSLAGTADPRLIERTNTRQTVLQSEHEFGDAFFRKAQEAAAREANASPGAVDVSPAGSADEGSHPADLGDVNALVKRFNMFHDQHWQEAMQNGAKTPSASASGMSLSSSTLLSYLSRQLEIARKLMDFLRTESRSPALLANILPLAGLDTRHESAKVLVNELLIALRPDLEKGPLDTPMLVAYTDALERLAYPADFLTDVRQRTDVDALTQRLAYLTDTSDFYEKQSLISAIARVVDIFASKNRDISSGKSATTLSLPSSSLLALDRSPSAPQQLTMDQSHAAMEQVDRFKGDDDIGVAFEAWRTSEQITRTPTDESKAAFIFRVAVHVVAVVESVAALVASHGSSVEAYVQLYRSVRELVAIADTLATDQRWDMVLRLEELIANVRVSEAAHSISLRTMRSTIASAMKNSTGDKRAWLTFFCLLRGIRSAALEQPAAVCRKDVMEFLVNTLADMGRELYTYGRNHKGNKRCVAMAEQLVYLWTQIVVGILQTSEEEVSASARQVLTNARAVVFANGVIGERFRAAMVAAMLQTAGTEAIEAITSKSANKSRQAEVDEFHRQRRATFERACRDALPVEACIADMRGQYLRRLNDRGGRGGELLLYIEPTISLNKPTAGDTEVKQSCSTAALRKGILEQFDRPASQRQICLIMGEAGVGKSLLLDKLLREFLSDYNDIDANSPVAMLVPLPTMSDPSRNAIGQILSSFGCRSDKIDAFRERRLVLLVDGYDEVFCSKNIYHSNGWNNWNVVVVMAARLEYIEGLPSASGLFRTGTAHVTGPTAREFFLMSFSEAQRKSFWARLFNERKTARYNNSANGADSQAQASSANLISMIWSAPMNDKLHSGEAFADDLDHQVKSVPGLIELVRTPFILTIVTVVLGRLTDRRGDRPLMRAEVYEAFLSFWHEGNSARLLGSAANLPEGFDAITSFAEYGRDLSYQMLVRGHQSVVSQLGTYLMETEETRIWARFFDMQRPTVKYAYYGVPLRRDGNRISFIHKSVQEFHAAQVFFNALVDIGDRRRVEVTSPINTDAFLREHSVMRFVVDMVSERPEMSRNGGALWITVYASRTNPELGKAAANCITILSLLNPNTCNVFVGKDLSDIRIPGANVTGAVLMRANLAGADLSNASLANCCLDGANLTGANTEGVRVGEYARMIHDNWARDAVFSADGKQIISCGDDNTMRVWSTETQSQRHIIRPDQDGVLISVRTASNVVAVCSKTAVYTWEYSGEPKKGDRNDAAASRPLVALPFQGVDRFYAVDCIPVPLMENVLVVAAAGTAGAVLWSMATRAAPVCFKSQNLASVDVMTVTFDTHERIVIGYANGTVEVWSIAEKKMLHTFTDTSSDSRARLTSVVVCPRPANATGTEQTKIVTVFSFNVDEGERVVVPCEVNIWTVGDKKPKYIGLGRSVTVSPDGAFIVVAKDNILFLYATETGTLVQQFNGHTKAVRNIRFSKDGIKLVSASTDSTVRLWDAEAPSPPQLDGHNGYVFDVNFSADNAHIFSVGRDLRLGVWKADNGERLRQLEIDVAVMALSPNKQILVVPSDCQLIAYDTAALCSKASGGPVAPKYQWYKHNDKDEVTRLCFSPDGNFLATGHKDGSVVLWSVKFGASPIVTRRADLGKHSQPVWALVFSPDGSTLASGSQDKKVKLWSNWRDKPEERQLVMANWVRAVSFAPDSSKVVVALGASGAHIYNLSDLSVFQSIDTTTYSAEIYHAEHHLGRYIWVGGTTSIDVYRLGHPGVEYSFRGHTDWVRRLVFNGSSLVSCGDDSSVRVWNITNLDDVLQVLFISSRRAFSSENCVIDGIKNATTQLMSLLHDHGAKCFDNQE